MPLGLFAHAQDLSVSFPPDLRIWVVRRKGSIMEETRLEALEKPTEQEPKSRSIEADWTESEWFQVWLKLARHASSDSNGTFAR
jgi:hypothetical protein